MFLGIDVHHAVAAIPVRSIRERKKREKEIKSYDLFTNSTTRLSAARSCNLPSNISYCKFFIHAYALFELFRITRDVIDGINLIHYDCSKSY